MSRKRVKIPALTVPPTRYEVWWVDANFDNEYDGPARDYKSELIRLPQTGYHTKTTREVIVLAGSAPVIDGEVHVRDLMIIPRVHITAMTPVYTEEEFRAKAQAEKETEVG